MFVNKNINQVVIYFKVTFSVAFLRTGKLPEFRPYFVTRQF